MTDTFESATTSSTPETEVPAGVTNLDDGSIVVNGKVYTQQAAAKKIENADKHIETLEAENAEKDGTALTLLQRIEAIEGRANHEQDVADLVAKATAEQETPPTQEVSTDEIVAAVTDKLKAEELSAKQEQNLNANVMAAKEAYGDDFGKTVDSKASELGMTVDDAVDMARNKPAAFRRLFLPADMKVTRDVDSTGSTQVGVTGLKAPEAPKTQRFLGMSAKQRTAEIKRRMAALSD